MESKSNLFIIGFVKISYREGSGLRKRVIIKEITKQAIRNKIVTWAKTNIRARTRTRTQIGTSAYRIRYLADRSQTGKWSSKHYREHNLTIGFAYGIVAKRIWIFLILDRIKII